DEFADALAAVAEPIEEIVEEVPAEVEPVEEIAEELPVEAEPAEELPVEDEVAEEVTEETPVETEPVQEITSAVASIADLFGVDQPEEPETVEEIAEEIPAEPEVEEETPIEPEITEEIPAEPEIAEETPAEPEVVEEPVDELSAAVESIIKEEPVIAPATGLFITPEAFAGHSAPPEEETAEQPAEEAAVEEKPEDKPIEEEFFKRPPVKGLFISPESFAEQLAEPAAEEAPAEETPTEEAEETAPTEEQPAATETAEEKEYDGFFDNSLSIPEENHEETPAPQELIDELSDDIINNGRTMDFFDMPEEDDTATITDLFGEEEEKEPEVNPELAEFMVSSEEIFTITSSGTEQQPEEEDKEENEEELTIAQDVTSNIQLFEDLLEPLYKVKAGRTSNRSGILFDWELRIQALIGGSALKKYWRLNFGGYEFWDDATYQDRADDLLSILEYGGIVRGPDKEVAFDKYTLKFYMMRDERANIQVGDYAEVVRPCWTNKGQPLIMGEIKPKANDSERMTVLDEMLKNAAVSDTEYDIPVNADNFRMQDRELPTVKQAIADGKCRCAVNKMENGDATIFFFEVLTDEEGYDPGTYRFEATLDKNARLIGRFRSEKI
ncbi:MAG: hypothetical protein J1E39_04475, partial [Eubacterium sp.]|nr:hypothetical protein [Eubacterium sp.]